MLRAVSLLPFLKDLQRFSTISHPIALVACYVAPDSYHDRTFTGEQTDDGFAGHTKRWLAGKPDL